MTDLGGLRPVRIVGNERGYVTEQTWKAANCGERGQGLTVKKVLIINYHFPPDAAIGAVRFAKFAKYLPEFGWEPVVYTVDESCYERCDPAKFEEALKALSIHRVTPMPGLLELCSRLHPNAFHEAPHNGNGPTGQETPSLRISQAQERGPSLKRLAGSMLRVPDDKQGWILGVIRDGLRIIKREKIGVFVTSGPPMGTHVGGAVLRGLTGARWIADFRDPWWGACQRMAPQFRTDLSDSLTRKLESFVVKRADLVISTAPALTAYFKSLLPGDRGGKCVTITNGFDEDDFTGIGREALPGKDRRIRICHAGSLYVGRNPEPFFAALRALADRREIDGERMSVEFIGDCNDYNGASMAGLIEKHGVESMVRLAGPMAHRACLERLACADGLLLFAQDFAEQIPAKVFEYLRINRPVLAVITEGDASRVLKGSPNVFMADPHAPGRLEAAFLQMVRAIEKKAEPEAGAECFRQYDRRNLTRQLAGYLG